MTKLNLTLTAVMLFPSFFGSFIYGSEYRQRKISHTADGSEIIWIKDSSNPNLGEAWRDPRGVIWGDLLRDNDGNPIMVRDAKMPYELCKSKKARVPDYTDVQWLVRYLGGSNVGLGIKDGVLKYPPPTVNTSHFKPAVLSDLDKTFASEGSVYPPSWFSSSRTAYVLYSGNGNLHLKARPQFEESFILGVYVRCVSNGEPQPPEQVITNRSDGTKAIWTREIHVPEYMGSAWKDSRGVIWGDVIRDSDTHEIKELSAIPAFSPNGKLFSDADSPHYDCKLARENDYRSLISDTSGDLKVQALPNLHLPVWYAVEAWQWGCIPSGTPHTCVRDVYGSVFSLKTSTIPPSYSFIDSVFTNRIEWYCTENSCNAYVDWSVKAQKYFGRCVIYPN